MILVTAGTKAQKTGKILRILNASQKTETVRKRDILSGK